MNVVVFPGLDGTSLLPREFATLANARVIEYPREVLSYDALAERAIAQMPERPVIIGESFGGAIAVLVAARLNAAALVLCNSFIVSPAPRALGLLPMMIPPEWLLAWLMTDGSREKAKMLRETINSLPREVLTSRLRMALSVDVRKALAATSMPLLDLRSRGDRIVGARNRSAVLRERPDAVTTTVDGPHALLFSEPAIAWEAIRHFIC
jgi:pimeloyl-ACP methyl ester carboxylesterase